MDELVDIIKRTGRAEAGWIYVSDFIRAVPVAGGGMISVGIYGMVALVEIAGCFTFWA